MNLPKVSGELQGRAFMLLQGLDEDQVCMADSSTENLELELATRLKWLSVAGAVLGRRRRNVRVIAAVGRMILLDRKAAWRGRSARKTML